jgi:hypothetical protein
LAAGCGGAARPPTPVADRVCGGAQHAAAALLGRPISGHIADRDPANLRCTLHGRSVRVVIVSQASARAYTEFDTTSAHQSQVYGPGVHQPGQIPVAVSVAGAVVAVWIPAEREIVATDAMPNQAGAYLTVTVSGPPLGNRQALTLALAVARASFAAHPDSTS